MAAERALESKCKDCENIKKIMTDPDAPYLKGAKLADGILFLCFKCAEEMNRVSREEKFPEVYKKIKELQSQGKSWINNITLPDSNKGKKKKKN